MVKNLIFDVGDVLLEYRWRDMLTDHGLRPEEAERLGDILFSDPLWRELDLGNFSDQEIIDQFRAKYPADGDTIDWFITHGEFMHVPREDVWQEVHRLKKSGFPIYLLSNYSQSLFEKHTRGASFLEDIDGLVVSYMIHIAKPDAGIYRHLLEKYRLVPEECLFFDDRMENVQAARELGLEAIQVLSRKQLLEELKKL